MLTRAIEGYLAVRRVAGFALTVGAGLLRHFGRLSASRAVNHVRREMAIEWALWLGHESTQTTEEYLRVDVTQRIGALKAVTPPHLRPGTFRPTDALIASLRG